MSSIPYNRSLDLTKSRSSSSGSLQRMKNSSDHGSSGQQGSSICRRWSFRSMILLIVGGFFFASIQKEFAFSSVYTRSIKDSSSPSYSHQEILSQAQRRTRIKFATGKKGKLDLSTTRLVQATLQHFLQQVEEGAGSNAQVSVGLMKDNLLQVMEHIEIEALASVQSEQGATPTRTTQTSRTKPKPSSAVKTRAKPSSTQLRPSSVLQGSNVARASAKEEQMSVIIDPEEEERGETPDATFTSPTRLDEGSPMDKFYSATRKQIGLLKATRTAATLATADSVASSSSQRPDGLKVALYMTTHVSDEHLEFIQKCWPAAMQKLEIFQHVDLIVYTSSKRHDRLFRGMGFDHVQIYRYNETEMEGYEGQDVNKVLPNNLNMQKQQGALRAMVDPFLVDPAAEQKDWQISGKSWFDDYDWVIRVNPDVMVRRDAWLLKQMRDPQIQGIFVRWDTPYFGLYLHTDFYAFRPTAVNPAALIREYKDQYRKEKFHAERHFRSGFTHLQDQTPPKVAFLPGVNKTKIGVGHVGGPDCDVVHVHELVQHCPNYFRARHRKGYY